MSVSRSQFDQAVSVSALSAGQKQQGVHGCQQIAKDAL